MSFFADRKYCKAGKGEEDMILGYMAERKKNPTKIKKKYSSKEKERIAWMILRKKKNQQDNW